MQEITIMCFAIKWFEDPQGSDNRPEFSLPNLEGEGPDPAYPLEVILKVLKVCYNLDNYSISQSYH